MLICKQCNWENPTYAAFCTNCGTGIGEKKNLTASGETWRFRGRENPELAQDDKANGPDTGQPSSETGQPTHMKSALKETMKVSSSMGTGASLSAVDRRTLVDMTAPDFKAVTAQSPEDIDTEFGTPTRPLGSQETLSEEQSAAAVTDHPGLLPAPESIATEAAPSYSADSEASVPPEAPTPAIEGLKATSSKSGQRLPISFADTMDLQGEAEFLEPPKPSGLRDLGSLDVVLESMDGELDDGTEELSNPSSEAASKGDKEILLSSVDLSIEEVASGLTADAPIPPPPPMATDAAHIGLRGLSLGSDDVFKLSTDGLTIGRSSAQLSIESDQFLSETHGRVGADEHGPWIEDLESLNGIWIRSSGLMRVASGDEFLLGSQVFLVRDREDLPEKKNFNDSTQPFGSHRARTGLKLSLLAHDRSTMAEFDVPLAGCKIGRSIGDFIVSDDETLSATHALIQPNEDGGLDVRDLSTGNGCWKRIRKREYLQVGDSILCGRSAWRVARLIRDEA